MGDVSDVGAKRIYYISKLKSLQNPASKTHLLLPLWSTTFNPFAEFLIPPLRPRQKILWLLKAQWRSRWSDSLVCKPSSWKEVPLEFYLVCLLTYHRERTTMKHVKLDRVCQLVWLSLKSFLFFLSNAHSRLQLSSCWFSTTALTWLSESGFLCPQGTHCLNAPRVCLLRLPCRRQWVEFAL